MAPFSKVGPHLRGMQTTAGQLWVSNCSVTKALDNPSLFGGASGITIFRAYMGDGDSQYQNNSPQSFFNTVISRLGGYRPSYIEGPNECGYDDIQGYVSWLQQYVAIAHQNGYRVAAFSWGTGWPQPDQWAYARSQGWAGADAIAMHCYWGSQGFTPYNALRWTSLGVQSGDPPIVITECGRDAVEGGQAGWIANNLSAQQYVAELEQYDNALNQYSYVLGATVFTHNGGDSGFENFEIDPLAAVLWPQGGPPVSGNFGAVCVEVRNALAQIDGSWASATCDQLQAKVQGDCTLFTYSPTTDSVPIREAAQCINGSWQGCGSPPTGSACGSGSGGSGNFPSVCATAKSQIDGAWGAAATCGELQWKLQQDCTVFSGTNPIGVAARCVNGQWVANCGIPSGVSCGTVVPPSSCVTSGSCSQTSPACSGYICLNGQVVADWNGDGTPTFITGAEQSAQGSDYLSHIGNERSSDPRWAFHVWLSSFLRTAPSVYIKGLSTAQWAWIFDVINADVASSYTPSFRNEPCANQMLNHWLTHPSEALGNPAWPIYVYDGTGVYAEPFNGGAVTNVTGSYPRPSNLPSCCWDQGVPGCGADTDCCSGLVCLSGTCSPPPPQCGLDTQPCCTTGPACRDVSNTCINGTCVGCGSYAGWPCCSSGAIAPGLICQNGTLVNCGYQGEPCCAGGTCIDTNQYCNNGICQVKPPPPPNCGNAGVACSVSTDCCAGFVCFTGTCQPPPPPCQPQNGQCGSTPDCCSPLVCISGSCQPRLPSCSDKGGTCSIDSQCCAPYICLGGFCETGPTCSLAGEPCSSNTECCGGLECVSGMCQEIPSSGIGGIILGALGVLVVGGIGYAVHESQRGK